MALNIKDPETDRLARELAAATGESITVAARVALEERLQRVRARGTAEADRSIVREIIERGRHQRSSTIARRTRFSGYDENGLPE